MRFSKREQFHYGTICRLSFTSGSKGVCGGGADDIEDRGSIMSTLPPPTERMPLLSIPNLCLVYVGSDLLPVKEVSHMGLVLSS